MGFVSTLTTVGRYQWRVLALYVMLQIPGWCDFGIVVFTPNIDYKCTDFNSTTSQCEMVGNGSSLKCGNFEYDHSMFSWTLTERFNLVCGRKYIISIMKSVYIAGYLIGSFLSGVVSDRLGRKVAICGASLTSALVNIGLAFVPNVWVHVFLRFVNATCAKGYYLPLYVLASEIVRKDQRFIPSLMEGIMYPLSAVVLGGLSFVLSNHVHYHLIFSAALLLMFTWTYFCIMESPRWLKLERRGQRAQKIVEKMAAINHTEVDEALLKIDEEETEQGTVLDLFRTRLIRKRTIVLCLIWFIFVLAYYTILYNLGEFNPDVRLTLMISGAIEVVSCFPTAFLIKKFGRTSVQFVVLVIAGLSCLGMAPLVENKTHPALMALAICGKVMLICTYFIMYTFTPELFPTVIRGRGLGMCSMAARMVAIVSPQLALLNQFWPPFMVVLLGVLVLSVALLVPVLPDMTNVELAQTIEDGENLYPDHAYGLRKARVAESNGVDLKHRGLRGVQPSA